MIEVAKFTLIFLAVLVLAGGIAGFVKAKSKASLIAGLVSAALLGVCFVYSQANARIGITAGDVVCVLLVATFVARLRKTGKFMPSGLMMVLSAIAATIATIALVTSPGP